MKACPSSCKLRVSIVLVLAIHFSIKKATNSALQVFAATEVVVILFNLASFMLLWFVAFSCACCGCVGPSLSLCFLFVELKQTSPNIAWRCNKYSGQYCFLLLHLTFSFCERRLHWWCICTCDYLPDWKLIGAPLGWSIGKMKTRKLVMFFFSSHILKISNFTFVFIVPRTLFSYRSVSFKMET